MSVKTISHITVRDVILGGQDGLVNVLGLTLGLFAAGATTRIIIVAGLAAAFSEAVSMGAVAYTSASADKERVKERLIGGLLFDAAVVGISALIFAVLPLAPFLFFTIRPAIASAAAISAIILYGFGISKAHSVGGSAWKSGVQILLIGLVSALAGFGIGFALKI